MTDDEVAVAAALDAILAATDRHPVRRTMLQAVIDAAQQQPSDTELSTLDREDVSEALLTLRARHLAALRAEGFELTPSGTTALSRSLDGRDLRPLLERLQGLVRLKFNEWSIAQ